MFARKLIKTANLLITLGLAASAAALAGDGTIHIPEGNDPIPGKYLVTFVPGNDVAIAAREAAATHGGRIEKVFKHVGVALLEMNEGQARGLARNPNVQWVEQDSYGTIDATSTQFSPASWGLDRVDETTLPMDNRYNYCHSGKGVNIYILDTGIRHTHNDFGDRVLWGINCTSEAQSDGHGHGTHVAGTAAGTTYGVAKDAKLIAVKVCNNNGSCPTSAITCGTDYVTQQKLASPSTPTVANMSLRLGLSATLNNAVANSVASGVFYAVGAGNDSSNACNFSPASEPTAYTVGSTTSTDAGSWFTNFGNCLDIFAPGSSIVSAWASSDTATRTENGTSMASPHVAGAAALVLSEDSTRSPAQVDAVLDARATSGVLSSIGSGSPNRLLYAKPSSSCSGTCSLVDRVPTLSSNTSAVSTSGNFSSSYPAWRAFDGSNSSMWISETWETPAWIAYNFGTSTTITHYTITNTNGTLTSRAPKDFSFQGWNGSSWVTVDTRSNETDWVSGLQRTYDVTNPGSYTKYRLYVTDDNDSRSGVVVISIGNLEFLGCQSFPPNACFSQSAYSGMSPLGVTFNASCSSDLDGSIVSYTWNLGDGSIRSGQSVTNYYTAPGFYNVQLTVQDNDGLTDTAFGWISVCDSGGPFPLQETIDFIGDCPLSSPIRTSDQ